MTTPQPSSRPDRGRRRIVVTGFGLFSPIGVGAEAFWNSLAAGRSGVAKVELLDYCASPRNIAGEVKDFTETTAKKAYLSQQKKSLKVMCREIQLGVAAAMQAVEHSGLDLKAVDHQRFGVDFGANLMFSPPDVLKDPAWACVEDGDETRDFKYDRWGSAGENAGGRTGMGAMEPLWLLKFLPNMPGCHIGIALSASGPNNSLTLEEASGLMAVSEAFRIMERGSADVMLAGATGTRLHPVKSVHAKLWDQLAESDDPPETWYRPFDARRMGQVIAEGSGAVILEDEAAAVARGATIYGEVLGSGASCVIDRSGTVQIRTALANAMRAALRDAGLQPGDIGHVNAHGLGTIESDRDEAAAIHDVFGELGSRVPVTAVKSFIGNSGAGCGVLELAASLLGLRHGVVPPTLNYTQPDPECPLNVVHGELLPIENKTVLAINVTRMGQAAAVIVRGA